MGSADIQVKSMGAPVCDGGMAESLAIAVPFTVEAPPTEVAFA